MGKSVVAGHLRRLGFLLYDADAQAHALLLDKKVVLAIQQAFGRKQGDEREGIDRAWLRRLVLTDEKNLRVLESILHPRLRCLQERFLFSARLRRPFGVVLDIPLLFEKGAGEPCDCVFVASCPSFLQHARLRRRGFSCQEAQRFIAMQMSDREKRRRADFVIPTGLGLSVSWRAVLQSLFRLRLSLPAKRKRTWSHLALLRDA